MNFGKLLLHSQLQIQKMVDEDTDKAGSFQWWKWVMVLFAFGGSFFGSGMETAAGAVGYALGVAVVSGIVIIASTAIYRNSLPGFLSPIPNSVYISICLLAAAVGGFVALVSAGSGGFVMTYSFLLLPALAVFWTYDYISKSKNTPPRTDA